MQQSPKSMSRQKDEASVNTGQTQKTQYLQYQYEGGKNITPFRTVKFPKMIASSCLVRPVHRETSGSPPIGVVWSTERAGLREEGGQWGPQRLSHYLAYGGERFVPNGYTSGERSPCTITKLSRAPARLQRHAESPGAYWSRLRGFHRQNDFFYRLSEARSFRRLRLLLKHESRRATLCRLSDLDLLDQQGDAV